MSALFDSSQQFQSTLPSRGETAYRPSLSSRYDDFNPLSPHGERPIKASTSFHDFRNFNPLSPHGERLKMFLCNISISLISIHSPLTGRDSILRQHNGRNIHFNPLSPHGERHNTQMIMPMQFIISIHSPLTGRDKQIAQDEIDSVKISIHSPLTGRDVIGQL